MTGKIAALNRQKSFYAIDLGNESYIVFKLIDSVKIDIGHLISGNFDVYGNVKLKNETTGDDFEAYIKEIKCSKINAQKMLDLIL